MKPTPSLFMFPQAISIHRYFTPEAASEAGLGEPEQFSPGSVVVNVIWPDSISGYYEETPERTFMCTVSTSLKSSPRNPNVLSGYIQG
jgi:hypothetical protein